jgi:hypothetical protein
VNHVATSSVLHAAAPFAEADAKPFWTPARIDLARRLWAKGLDEPAILAAISRLAGPPACGIEDIGALARRLRWPGPRLPPLPPALLTRDGAPSIAERQAAELVRALNHVELPLEDALAWGRANGVTGAEGEPIALLLQRINLARKRFGLPRFRVSRRG